MPVLVHQPALQTIRFRIRADGRVEETVEGIVGPDCERLTERIEACLGTVQRRQPTAAAYQPTANQQSASAEWQLVQYRSDSLPSRSDVALQHHQDRTA